MNRRFAKFIPVFKVRFKESSLSIKPTGLNSLSFEERYVTYNKREIFEKSVELYNQTANHGYRFNKGLKSRLDFDIIYGSTYIVFIQAYLQAKQLFAVSKSIGETIQITEIIEVSKFKSSDDFFKFFFSEKYWHYLMNIVMNIMPEVSEPKPVLSLHFFDSRNRVNRGLLRMFGIFRVSRFSSKVHLWRHSELALIETSFLLLLDKQFCRMVSSKVAISRVNSENLFWNSSVLKGLLINAEELITYQHGGNIGMYDFNTFEWYQNLVSKTAHYWFDSDTSFKFNKSIKPVDDIKNEFSILIVLVSVPRFNYYIHGFPLSDNYRSYLSFNVQIAEKFPPNKVIFRTYMQDYGWGTSQYIEEKGYTICDMSFKDSLNYHSLRIIGYNATAWLQSLELGPTILIMHQSISDISINWHVMFQEMKDVGLIIEEANIDRLSKFKTQENILSWWNSENVTRVRERFMTSYMYNG